MATPKTLILEGMHGIGDNVIQAPIAGAFSENWGNRGLSRVYLRTPWPQLYWRWDNLKFLLPRQYQHLHHATRNVEHCPGFYFQDEPLKGETVRVSLGRPNAYKNGTSFYQEFVDLYVETMGAEFPEPDYALHVPDLWQFAARQRALSAYERSGTQRVAILNLPTLMRDPCFKSRLPDPEAVVEVVRRFQAEDYFVVGLANVEYGREWIAGAEDTDVVSGQHAYGVDHSLVNALKCVEELVGLISIADAVITPVSGIQQIAIATRTPCFAIYGGHLANHHIVDERMDLSLYVPLSPDPFCNCHDDDHDCNKKIDPAKLGQATNDFFELTASLPRNVPCSYSKQEGLRDRYCEIPAHPGILERLERLEKLQSELIRVEASELEAEAEDPVLNEIERDGDLWVRTKWKAQDHVLVDAVYNQDEYLFGELSDCMPDRSINFLDIGGGIGSASAKWNSLRPQDRVSIFEANQDNVDLIRANCPWASIWHHAIWPTAGGFQFLNAITPTGCESTGGSLLVSEEGLPAWQEALDAGRYVIDPRTIPTCTIIEAMGLSGMDHVDILKIDAEGAEYEVLPQAPLDRIGTIIGEYHRSRREFFAMVSEQFPRWHFSTWDSSEDIGLFCLHNPERWQHGEYEPFEPA